MPKYLLLIATGAILILSGCTTDTVTQYEQPIDIPTEYKNILLGLQYTVEDMQHQLDKLTAIRVGDSVFCTDNEDQVEVPYKVLYVYNGDKVNDPILVLESRSKVIKATYSLHCDTQPIVINYKYEQVAQQFACDAMGAYCNSYLPTQGGDEQ